MENTNIGQVKKKKFNKTILILVLVVVITVGLHVYNSTLQKSIVDLDDKIQAINTSITEEKKDDNLVIFSLLSANKSSIETLEKRSNISTYISHLKDIASTYNLAIRGFNLTSGKLTTQVVAESSDTGIAYKQVRDFIQGYRADSAALFDLGFVKSISGYDTMKFNIDLNIK